MNPVDRVISALEARGLSARGSDERGWTAQCPAHDDRNASLSIGMGDDERVLLCCHAGCTLDAILGELALESRDLFVSGDGTVERPNRPRRPPGGPPTPLPSDEQLAGLQQRLVDDRKIVDRLREVRGWTRDAMVHLGVGWDGQRIVFPIRDRNGTLVNQCRYSPRPSDGERKMISLAGRPRDLYPAPESINGDVVWLVEGEPDSLAATSIGLPAFGLPGVEFAKRLDVERLRRFSRVHIVLDCDQPGRDAAVRIASALAKAGVESRVVDLEPTRDDGWDLGDVVREAAQDGPNGLVSARHLLERMAAAAEPAATAEATVGTERASEATRWPKPLDQAAYHGLAGEIVRAIEPHTEADPAAVLVAFLVAFGNVIGRGAGWKHGGTFHATNLYALLVGPTSSGRKGTAGDEVLRVFEMVDLAWAHGRVVSGLSTGEGLVWQVRDPITRRRKAKKDEAPNLPDGWLEEVEDPGEADKRLLVVEAEFAQALKVMQREGNTLSATVRRLWERGDARSMVKTSPGRTTGALVSITGHISAEELRRQLNDTEIVNGFANRFLIVCSRRSKRLPFGGSLTDTELARFVPRLREAVEHSHGCRELGLDDGARALWKVMYEELSDDRLGLVGAVLGRAAPIVRRLAVIYALLDCQPIVRAEHLLAAADVWRYCEDSARFVFGDAVGNRLADKFRRALRDAGSEWLSREQLRKVAGSHNIPAPEIEAALRVLRDAGLAECKHQATDRGRRPELWHSTESWEEWEGWEESDAADGVSSHYSYSSHGEGTWNGSGAPAVREEEATPEEQSEAERLIRKWGGA